MSLTDATVWPQYIVDFASSTKVSGYYFGLYNKLLFNLFDPSYFNLAPEKSDFDTIYLIIYTRYYRPLLIAHVQNDVSLNGRVKADQQMRQRYDALLTKCPLSRLWGMSFVGTALRVYYGDVTTGSVVPPSEDHLDQAWNIDLLSAEGFAKVKQIVKLVQNSALLY
jgi:hypothetical protein